MATETKTDSTKYDSTKTASAQDQTQTTSVTTPQEADLPSRDDAGVKTATRSATSDSDDPNVGWTNQQSVPEDSVVVENTNVVSKEALPTREGLEDAGVYDANQYLSSVKREEDVTVNKNA